MNHRGERLALPGAGVGLAANRWGAAGPAKGLVLLLHGGGQTRHSWQRTGQDLAAAGWTTIAADLRGHGESDWAPDGDYSPDAMVADLRAAVGALDERPVLVGASMGGMTSLLALDADPGLARGLVLVDVTPRIEEDGTAEITRFMQAGLDGFATVEEAADAVAAYNPHRARPPRADGLRKNLRRRGDRWYWHWDPQLLANRVTTAHGRARLGHRARDAARRLRVPTMLVRGRQSRVVGVEGVRELRELVPTAHVVDVAGAGHMVAGDDNDIFGEHLLQFLEGPVWLAG